MVKKKDLQQIQKDVIGFELLIRTKQSLETVKSMKLVLRVGSSKTEIDLDQSNIKDAINGDVSYKTKKGDLSIAGDYKAQLIDTTDGNYFPSTTFEFKVVPNLE